MARWLKCGAAVALALIAMPASAKEDRALSIARTARICDGLLTAPGEVAAQLRRDGWKSITPVIGETSMAAITGAELYSRGKDTALISGVGSAAGPNCQFNFAGVSEGVAATVESQLNTQLGAPTEVQDDRITWAHDHMSSTLLRRSPNNVTILWLPETKAAN
jgi:hypothetical protein